MSERPDPILDTDLDAYIDDQLDVARRVDVEVYLSAHPDVAARVMSDLRIRDELRLALAASKGMALPRTNDAARRLERGLWRNRLLNGLQRVAAVGLLVGAGWFANEAIGPFWVAESAASIPPPAYVEDAVRAHNTSVVRAAMASQPEVSDFDADEIRAATAIILPVLPDGWLVKDVQVYPSQFGPSVEITVESKEYGMLSLFAVRPGTFDVVSPTALATADATAAYFQIGEVAYALIAKADVTKLDRAAVRLASTLY